MLILGRLIAIFASLVWTVSSLTAEVSGKRIGAVALNFIALLLAVTLTSIVLFCLTGSPFPQHLDLKAASWIVGSGILGFGICNFFLFNAYIIIGSRFSQLFMTLVIPSSAFAGWILLDEKLTIQEYIGMSITFCGIIISILSKGQADTSSDKSAGIGLKLAPKGVVFALIASVAQGMALVFGKVGMMHYHQGMPADLAHLTDLIPLSASCIRLLVSFCCFVCIAAITRNFSAIKSAFQNKKGLIFALLTGLTGPCIGATCSLVAMRYAKAGIAATLLELTPVLIILPAYLILKQKVHWIEVVGALVSVFGVSLFFIHL